MSPLTVEVHANKIVKTFSCPGCGYTRTLWQEVRPPGFTRYAAIEATTWKMDRAQQYTEAYLDICPQCGSVYAVQLTIACEDPILPEDHPRKSLQLALQLMSALDAEEINGEGMAGIDSTGTGTPL